MSHYRQNSTANETQARGRGIFPAKPRRIPPPHVTNEELEVMLSGSPTQSRSPSPTQRERTIASPAPSVPGTPKRLKGPRALPPSPQRTLSTDSRSDLDDLRRRLEVVNVSQDSLGTPGSPSSLGFNVRPIFATGTPPLAPSLPASPQKLPRPGSASLHGPRPVDLHAPRPEYPKQRPYLASSAFDIPPSPSPTQNHAGLGSSTRTTSGDIYPPPSPTRAGGSPHRTPSPTDVRAAPRRAPHPSTRGVHARQEDTDSTVHVTRRRSVRVLGESRNGR